MKPRAWALVVMVSAISCGSNEDKNPERKDGFTPVLTTKEDSLQHEVMEGHDIAMARMDRLSRYIEQIKNTLDSLQKLPAEKQDIIYQQDLMELQKELEAARSGMNVWMDDFKADSAENNKELRLQYLESEKQKVSKMKDAILSSLHKADSVFKK